MQLHYIVFEFALCKFEVYKILIMSYFEIGNPPN